MALYGVEAVGKFVRRRSPHFQLIRALLSILMDTYYVDYDRAPPSLLAEIATFIFMIGTRSNYQFKPPPNTVARRCFSEKKKPRTRYRIKIVQNSI